MCHSRVAHKEPACRLGNFEKKVFLDSISCVFEETLLGNKAGKSEGHVECIIEINLESHNLVQNIPHESANVDLQSKGPF